MGFNFIKKFKNESEIHEHFKRTKDVVIQS